MGRLAEAVRSYWLGPFGTGDKALTRLLSQGGPTLSGVSVNEQNALTLSPIWAAVRVISEDVASLPLHLHKRLPGGGKERFTSHRLYKLLHDEPNPEMSSMAFREMLQAHALTWGTGYAEIVRDGSGHPAELWPLHPAQVQWDRDRGGRLIYHVTNADGTRTTLARTDMFRLPGLSDNGVTGYSPIRLGLQSHGLTKATEAFGATFFGNGARPGGLLEHPARLSDKVKEQLRENLQGMHGGVANANKIAILEEGMKYHAISVPPEDAQFLSTREFQVVEVARWFNISPTKLRDLSRATFTNVEHEAIAHVVHTLRPWLCRWEQEIQRSLVAPLERTQQFAEHLIDGLLRGDIGSRYNAYAIAREKGWLSADDIREFENMNPLPDGQGKVYLIPSNMVPAGRIDEVIDAQVRPKPAPVAAAPAAKPDDEAKAERDAFLLHILPKLDDLARRVGGLQIPTEDAIADVFQQSLAATDAGVETVAEMLRTQADGARAALAETLGKVDALTERVRLAEQARHAVEDATREGLDEMSAALTARLDAQIQHATESVAKIVALDERIAAIPQPEPVDLTPLTESVLALQAQHAEAVAARVSAEETLTAAQIELVAAQTELRERIEAIPEPEPVDLAPVMREIQERGEEMIVPMRALLAQQAEIAAARKAAEESIEAAVVAAQAELVTAQTELRERIDAAESARLEQARVDVEEVKADIATRLEAQDQRALEAAEEVKRALAESEARVVETQTELRSRLDASEAACKAQAERIATLAPSLHDVIEGAVRKEVRFEADRARKAAQSPEKLRAWMESFYATRVDSSVGFLLPAMRLHFALTGRADDAEAETRRMIGAHVAESRTALEALLATPTETLSADVETLVARWESDRPAAIADELMREVIANV